MTESKLTAESARYCYLDIDIDGTRQKLATTAAFVHATDTRYGFSSKDLRELGGSELNRIGELMATDHEWHGRVIEATLTESQQVLVKPPPHGCRIIVQLDWETAPMACENFATLCENGSGFRPPPMGTSGKPLTYRNTKVHRVVPGFIFQGGDLVMGNGSGGESIYGGKKFKDERAGLLKKHNERGLLGMGNSGKNSNSSQWYITLAAAPQCDGKHVIFGRVISGWDVIAAVENRGLAGREEPSVTISITDCGVWKPFSLPGDGNWFDKPDPESYSGISPVFCVRPRIAVVASNNAVYEKFQTVLSASCYLTSFIIQESLDGAVQGTLAKLSNLISDYSIDFILVAPACNAIIDAVQVSWLESSPVDAEKVIMECKPLDAMATVKSKSWLADKESWYVWF